MTKCKRCHGDGYVSPHGSALTGEPCDECGGVGTWHIPPLNCTRCGKFCTEASGAKVRDVYSYAYAGIDDVRVTCPRCQAAT